MTSQAIIRSLIFLTVCVCAPSALSRAQKPAAGDALALEQNGRTTEAEQIWHQLASEHPDSPEPLAHLGLLAARKQDFNAAIGFYQKALALDAALPGLRMNLGLACFKAGRFSDAIKAFQLELKLHPGDERLTILLGMSHYGMADYLVAIPYLERASQHDTTNLPLHLALAHSCLWSKQYPCVLTAAKAILTIDPNSAEADMLTGETLDEQGESISAIEQFRAAVKADPSASNAHFGLGYLLWKQGQFGEAIAQFREELNNDGGHVQARIYLADALVATGDLQQAEPELLRAVAAAPMSAMVHRDLGILYADKGDSTHAIEDFNQAIALDPKDVASHLRLARLYRASGDKEQSRMQSEMASRITRSADEASDALLQKLPQDHRSQP